VRRLLTVEDTFAITGRGLLVAPMPEARVLRGAGDIEAELRLPDGTRRTATMTVNREFVHPTPAAQRWACLFPTLGKADVPIGTEVWCPESAFMPSLHPVAT
jgi:hypothetical protein